MWCGPGGLYIRPGCRRSARPGRRRPWGGSAFRIAYSTAFCTAADVTPSRLPIWTMLRGRLAREAELERHASYSPIPSSRSSRRADRLPLLAGGSSVSLAATPSSHSPASSSGRYPDRRPPSSGAGPDCWATNRCDAGHRGPSLRPRPPRTSAGWPLSSHNCLLVRRHRPDGNIHSAIGSSRPNSPCAEPHRFPEF